MNKTADQIELKRLRTLQNLDILDTESETSLDNISKLASHICECPVSLISLLDDKRQWFKSKVGLSVSETPRDISFCTHAIQQDDLFIIENAQADERFRLNPLVTADPSIRFYAGAPLFINGVDKIGTLCVIDRQPRTLSDAQKECLKMLAAQAVEIIEKRSLLRQQINFQKNLLNLFDESSTIMAVMKGPEHHFEYTNSAHTQNFNSLDAEAFRHPEMKKILDDVYLLGKTISLKDKAFIVDGSERYFNSIFTPSFSVDGTVDGVMSIMNDKTSEKMLENDLRSELLLSSDSLRSLKGFMEAVPMPVALLMGPDHRFQFANDSYRNFFLSDKSYVGKSVQELMPQADSEGLVSLLNNVYETGVAFKGNESHFQFSPSPEVQQSLYMNFVYEPMRNESGDTIGVIAAISDVTEQVASKKDLEKERDMREKFVATLTHDLRTPLTAAKISAQLLARKGDDLTSIHKFTGRIVSNMERADHMIRDLLDANRITAGETLPLELSQFSLDHLIREVVEEMGAIYGDRFEYSSGKKIEGSWSYSGLRRVLENLCGNAVKYGASDSPVRISTSTSGGFVSIEVWNRGNPIDKSHIDNLFKAYIRSNRLQDATQKGWGLGLTLVKGLVEAHGGEISVTSHAESGTSFVAKLPIQASVLV